MEPELRQKLGELERKIDSIYVSSEKTRKYFLWTLILSVVLFVLPLIGVLLALPAFLNTLTNTQGLL